jgi:glutamyl-tRNA synthetase
MKDGTLPLLAAARDALAATAGDFTADGVEATLSPLPEALGVKPGKLYQPIRVAITGTTVSPGIFESLAVLGREQSLIRIDAAAERLRLGGQSGA